MPGHAPLSSGTHQIFDTDIGKRTAGHNSIIAPTRAVAVEILTIDTVINRLITVSIVRISTATALVGAMIEL